MLGWIVFIYFYYFCLFFLFLSVFVRRVSWESDRLIKTAGSERPGCSNDPSNTAPNARRLTFFRYAVETQTLGYNLNVASPIKCFSVCSKAAWSFSQTWSDLNGVDRTSSWNANLISRSQKHLLRRESAPQQPLPAAAIVAPKFHALRRDVFNRSNFEKRKKEKETASIQAITLN